MCIRDRSDSVKEREQGCSISGRGGQSAQAHAVHFRCGVACLLYTSDAADERSSVDLGGRRIIKKKNKEDKLTQSQH